MYSSIHKADIVTKGPDGFTAHQTDHRDAAEIEADPELSTLFALARVLVPLHQLTVEGKPIGVVHYVPLGGLPGFLREALASVGARIEREPGKPAEVLSGGGDPAAIADRAFAGLARRVCERLETTDRMAAIDELEAEFGDGGLSKEGDGEIEFWTGVLELMALTGEEVRARQGGAWVVHHDAIVPFGFRTGSGSTILAGNRAVRRLEDGVSESMRSLIESLGELASGKVEGPLRPSLRSRDEAEKANYVWRPLLERADDPRLPVVIYGNDGDRMFACIGKHPGDPPPDHDVAIANLDGIEVSIEEMEVEGMKFLSVGDSFFATEKLLDRAFMRTLHARLGDELLGVAVPRRGVMLVAGLATKVTNGQLLTAIAHGAHADGPRPISPLVILVQDGAPCGVILPSPAGGEPAKKKRGFFSRLFGRD